MADIHIGRMTRTGKNRRTVQLYYHIPLDTPVEGVVPTPVSLVVGQLEQDEIDALAAGTLVELTKNVEVPDELNQAQIVNRIKANWQSMKDSYNKQFSFEYKLYGMTLDAEA